MSCTFFANVEVQSAQYAYYQNVKNYSAYRHIDPMRCFNATFYAPFSERRRGRNAEKKRSEML